MSDATQSTEITEAVVLAGGEGMRLRPLTKNRPKPMLPAANRPILEYVFDALLASGITTLHVVVGYQRERVQGYFGSSYEGVPIRYYHQSKQLGSGHALLQAADGVSGSFLAVNGDQLSEPRMVADVIEANETNDARATLAVVESEKAPNYGAVELDGSTVTTFIERPQDESYRLLSAGVYGFEEAIFHDLTQTEFTAGTLALPDVLSTLIDGESHVEGVLTEGYWMDATYPWDLLTVARRLLQDETIMNPACDEGICVADGATIHDSAVLQPPVVVSDACEIGGGAVVGPYTALGPNVTVGPNAVVSESVIDEGSRIGANSTVLQTITGQDVLLGPECVIPGGQTDVCIDETIYTDKRLGAVFADRVHVEGDASFAPGSLIGPNATIHLGVRIDGEIDAGAEVLR